MADKKELLAKRFEEEMSKLQVGRKEFEEKTKAFKKKLEDFGFEITSLNFIWVGDELPNDNKSEMNVCNLWIKIPTTTETIKMVLYDQDIDWSEFTHDKLIKETNNDKEKVFIELLEECIGVKFIQYIKKNKYSDGYSQRAVAKDVGLRLHNVDEAWISE